MDTLIKNRKVSREAFLSYLDSIPGKAQYWDGEILDMAGGSIEHGAISANTIGAFFSRIAGKGCRIMTSDAMVEIDFDGSLVFPDASIVCGNPEFVLGRNDILRNPSIIVEVISPSTGVYDRGGKLLKYMQIKSLKEYIIIEQALVQIDVISRDSNGNWLINTYQSLSDEALIPSLQIRLPLSEIYRDVTFA